MEETNSTFIKKNAKRTYQKMLEQAPHSIFDKIDKSLPPIKDFRPSLKLSGPIFQEITLHHTENKKKCAEFMRKKNEKSRNQKPEIKNPFTENTSKNTNISSDNINEKSNPFILQNSFNNPFLPKSDVYNPFLMNNNSSNISATKEEKQKNDTIINPFSSSSQNNYNPFTQKILVIIIKTKILSKWLIVI